MKRFADKHWRELEFQVGDWVFLKFQPYKMRSLALKMNEKLSPRFYGPYQVLDRVGPVAYRLALPQSCRLHPDFHVSQLKNAIPPQVQPQEIPAVLAEDGELLLHPEAVLESRINAKGLGEVLIKWHDLPDCENSWEKLSDLLQKFPDDHLEDKVNLQGGSVGSRFGGQVYRRRERGDRSGLGPNS